MIKANLSNHCLTYRDLVIFDTTNQKYSGKFIDEKGFYHRDKPLIKNPEIVYSNLANYTVCVDCIGKGVLQFPTIIVESNSFTFKLDKDKKVTGNKIIKHQDKYVEGCFDIRVANNMTLVQQAIKHLVSGCTTDFNGKIETSNPYSKLSYDGLWYKHLKFLQDAKKLKGINCLKSTLC